MRLGRGGVPESTAFSQQLSELKREGCNLLVVGQHSGGGHSGACRHLLGDDCAGRRRLFTFTQGKRVCGCSRDDIDGDGREIVRFDPDAGGAAGDELGALGTDIVDAADALEADADGFEPAELRVCVDSLGPLFVEHDPERLFKLLHVVTARVRQADGMGHYHLRVDRDSDHVHLLEPLFDAVVEVRDGDDGAEQRWHLRSGDVSTDWLTL
ncbi:hypothetical protein SAMN06269185_0593 [Natronoarchaeum philippinense]|uniref:RecA-superfamily ATPase, KaiC/GvpD/RAD55 family n=1 Tax=Natronoarchaeum philippinense TaxID=558529 RepID=A0A285N6G1_NATPI|nr:hypothetical protein [Natronoarchaeum philippinense]SNZ04533.1 hypothetical protein SAMN06269185_0593 [Natronoarchaeum philippinense]